MGVANGLGFRVVRGVGLARDDACNARHPGNKGAAVHGSWFIRPWDSVRLDCVRSRPCIDRLEVIIGMTGQSERPTQRAGWRSLS
jgi:hypothetical protein